MGKFLKEELDEQNLDELMELDKNTCTVEGRAAFDTGQVTGSDCHVLCKSVCILISYRSVFWSDARVLSREMA